MYYIYLFQFNRNNGKQDEDTDMWIAYCAFHLGEYKRAMEVRYTMFALGALQYTQSKNWFCQIELI